jgi:two-component system, cell cycle response regulator CpdR
MARILIADDEEAIRTLCVRALTDDGHEVLSAADGAEALDVIGREQGRIDLLITDIQMPVMDGIALALAAARDYPDLSILLMTGYAEQRERAQGLDALVHDVLTKPFSLAEFRLVVQGVFRVRERH